MIHYFFPTAKNDYRANLLKIPALLAIALIIASFNFFVKIDTKAESLSDVISSENLLSQHNEMRKEAGEGALILNAKLNESAQNKAQKLLESNCWSHYCPDGESPWDFFKNAQYDYVLAGENLAEGFYNVNDLMTAWMNSQSHRDNILNANYKDVGFGIVKGTYQGVENNVIVVVHFGTSVDEITNSSSVQLAITSPHDGDILNQSSTKVEGSVTGLNEVDIFLNGVKDGKADIGDGLFTYNLKNLKAGDDYIYAQGPLTYGLTKESSVIKVTYDSSAQNVASISQPISITTSGISTTPEIKNIINIIFIVGLATLFLIDFLVLSRTEVLKQERSFAHYHFGLLLILVIIILAGGFSGNLAQAISI